MTKITLPIFLRGHNKHLYSAIGAIVGGTLYLLSNHFLIFPAHLLPMTALDISIPFLPRTVWIYNSDLFLFFAAYIFCKDLVNANKYLYSVLALILVSVTIFLLYPTIYPRGRYLLPPSLDPMTAMVFSRLRSIDNPSNCFPSLHVSMSYLSSFIFLDEQKEKFPLFFGWATLVAVSTLTTKQHYVVDVVSGLALAILIYYIFHRVVKYKSA